MKKTYNSLQMEVFKWEEDIIMGTSMDSYDPNGGNDKIDGGEDIFGPNN